MDPFRTAFYDYYSKIERGESFENIIGILWDREMSIKVYSKVLNTEIIKNNRLLYILLNLVIYYDDPQVWKNIFENELIDKQLEYIPTIIRLLIQISRYGKTYDPDSMDILRFQLNFPENDTYYIIRDLEYLLGVANDNNRVLFLRSDGEKGISKIEIDYVNLPERIYPPIKTWLISKGLLESPEEPDSDSDFDYYC